MVNTEKSKKPIWLFTIFIAGLGLLFDVYVQNVFVLLSPVIKKDLNLSLAQIGTITSLFLIGYALGSFFSGFFADKIGRRNSLTYSVAGYALVGALTALSQGFASFAAFRALTGVVASTEAPVGAISVVEASPDHRRGFSAGMWAAFYSAGYLLAVGVVALLIPRVSWRWPFAAILVVGFLVFWIRRSFQETPKYRQLLTTVQKRNKQVRATEILRDKKYIRGLLGFSILWIGNGFTFYAFLTFIPLYLTHERHYSFHNILPILAVAQISYAVIPWLIGRLSDSIGRKPAGMLSAVLAIGGTWLMVSLPNGIWFLIALWITYGLYDGTWVIAWAFVPESFPTEVRGTALGTTLLVGRIVSFVGPIVVGVLSSSMTIGNAYKLVSLAWLIVILGLSIVREIGSGNTVEHTLNLQDIS